MDMIGLDRQPDDLPVSLSCYLLNDLPQAVSHRPDEHRAAPLGTPDDVVHDAMDTVLFMFVVHVAMIA